MARRLLCSSGHLEPARMSSRPYDEMTAPDGGVRPHYRAFADWLERTDAARIAQKREEAERAFHRVGITFAVYGEDARHRAAHSVRHRAAHHSRRRMGRCSKRGLKQRVRALNLFLADVYHEQRILKAGAIPAERVLGNTQYRREMAGMDVPGGIYAHIAGVDIVRAGRGRVLRARGQPARAVRRVVHAREPQDDDAALSRALRHALDPAGPALSRHAAREPARASARRARRTRPWRC